MAPPLNDAFAPRVDWMERLKTLVLVVIACGVLHIAYNLTEVVELLDDMLETLVSSMETILNTSLFHDGTEPLDQEDEWIRLLQDYYG